MTIGTGFRGIVDISGSAYYCSDINVNVEQDILFYDHSYGLLDGIDTNSQLPNNYPINVGKTFLRPGPIIARGSLSVLPTASDFITLLNLAKRACSFDLKVRYNCDQGKKFTNCRINSFSFSIEAGDIAQLSLELIGSGGFDTTNTATSAVTSSAVRLFDWKQFVFQGISSGVKSFSLNINNNCFPIYTASGLVPYSINVGMQEVNGSYTIIDISSTDSTIVVGSTSSGSIIIYADTTSALINAMWKPAQFQGNPSLPVKTYAFVGIDKPLGE